MTVDRCASSEIELVPPVLVVGDILIGTWSWVFGVTSALMQSPGNKVRAIVLEGITTLGVPGMLFRPGCRAREVDASGGHSLASGRPRRGGRGRPAGWHGVQRWGDSCRASGRFDLPGRGVRVHIAGYHRGGTP